MTAVTSFEADTYVDPFGDDIVTEPRRIEPAVAGVNDEALQRLREAFRRICHQAPPRLMRDSGALLVLSPQPGYGKSHLLGRLFQELSGQATLLYLRPYQDPRSCFISLLEKVVVELSHPDGTAGEESDALTQLDIMARRVLCAVMSELLRAERVAHPDKEQALSLFEKYPNTALEMPEFRSWLLDERDAVLRALDRLLGELGVTLAPSRRAWLKVLLAYAYSDGDEDVRQLCLDWIAYRPLDPSEGGTLGLRFADLPDSDVPYELRNERCFERLSDLMMLGAFYRPFLLAFDQTELYGASPQLARSLGVVLSRLRRETCNHLTVVTANTHVFQRAVRPHFEEADAHSLHPTVIELHGMTEGQAQALVVSRLSGLVAAEDAIGFCGGFIPQLFERSTERSARDVLRRARAQFQRRAEPRAESSSAALARIFQTYRAALIGQPRGLGFDPGVLQWCVQHLLGPALDLHVEPLASTFGYLSLSLSDAHRTLLLGFETSNHWKRWEAILSEVSAVVAADHGGREVTIRYLRLPEQKPLPQRTHNRLVSLSGLVSVHELSLEQASWLFAAHDFAADVQQDNHDLDPEQVLIFLQQRLRPLAEQLWGASDPRGAAEPHRAPDGQVLGAQITALLAADGEEGGGAPPEPTLTAEPGTGPEVAAPRGAQGEVLAGGREHVPLSLSLAVASDADEEALSTPQVGTDADVAPSAPQAGADVDTVELSGADFRAHTAVLGGAGSGKTDLILNLVEQVLESNVPVLLVDRQGELARYADRAAWSVEDEPERVARRQALLERLDVALFTPGHGGGRPLRWEAVPALRGLCAEERRVRVETSAHVVADLMRLKTEGADAEQRALLCAAIDAVGADEPLGLPSLARALSEPSRALLRVVGDRREHLTSLSAQLSTFARMQEERLGEAGEAIDAKALLALGEHRRPDRVRLSIVNTQFVEGESAALSWVMQLLAALNRLEREGAEEGLQALVVFDEADVYLPAEGEPYTKRPLEQLLERGAAAGIGVVLSARHAADLDYRCRRHVHTWLVGRVREPRALARLKPLADAVGCDPVTAFANLAFGQFHMISDSCRAVFQGERSLLDPEPLSTRQILDLACAGRPDVAAASCSHNAV